jgi:hypothetical protein
MVTIVTAEHQTVLPDETLIVAELERTRADSNSVARKANTPLP